jgi:hypothetical protein
VKAVPEVSVRVVCGDLLLALRIPTAYADKGRLLTEAELNALIDELELRPTVMHLR